MRIPVRESLLQGAGKCRIRKGLCSAVLHQVKGPEKLSLGGLIFHLRKPKIRNRNLTEPDGLFPFCLQRLHAVQNQRKKS